MSLKTPGRTPPKTSTRGRCLEIAKVSDPQAQRQLAQECAQKDCSVRELQARVKKFLAHPTDGALEAQKPLKELPLFQFTWKKDAELLIRARYSAEKPLDRYFEELRTALEAFLTKPVKSGRAPAAPGAVAVPEEVPVAA